MTALPPAELLIALRRYGGRHPFQNDRAPIKRALNQAADTIERLEARVRELESGLSLDELRSAAAELARRCEIDNCADWPSGVDGSYLDRIREAIDATYPVIWTAEQVAKLNEYQAGFGHPFTCGSGNRMDAMHAFMRGEDEEYDYGQLIATPQGWMCPACDYRQFWAHDFMFNGALLNPLATKGVCDE